MNTEPMRWEQMTPEQRERAKSAAEKAAGYPFDDEDMQWLSDYNISARMGFEEFERNFHESTEAF